MLLDGGSAVDAVSLAVCMLEDCVLFNAGRGAVYTAEETHELDAALMDGRTLSAGAITGVSRVRNPILAARAVMERSKHVLMHGGGAERIAEAAGLTMVDPTYFATKERLEQVRLAKKSEAGTVLDHEGAAAVTAEALAATEANKMGTVGAVALDMHGHLAAATSTGGMTNKLCGRIGDSPQIGAGTYADDRYAAVSCTGHGEAFIRVSAAHDVCARMAYAGATLEQATRAVVFTSLPSVGGRGGLIAVDKAGNVCLPYNTPGMFRGHVRGTENPVVAVFAD